VLLIRRTKFGKSRLVPIHPTTQEALRAYGEARDRIVAKPEIPAVFVSERGTPITEWSTRYTFAVVSRRVGLRAPTCGGHHGQGLRIQDLRHRFAAQTLISWYRAGVDVERELPRERRVVRQNAAWLGSAWMVGTAGGGPARWEPYYESVALLVATGASVEPVWLSEKNAKTDPRMFARSPTEGRSFVSGAAHDDRGTLDDAEGGHSRCAPAGRVVSVSVTSADASC
jgi:hypothetical protein